MSEINQINMFGVTFKEMDEQIIALRDNHKKDKVVMSILSDSQELIERREIEKARQKINVAKYFLDSWDDV